MKLSVALIVLGLLSAAEMVESQVRGGSRQTTNGALPGSKEPRELLTKECLKYKDSRDIPKCAPTQDPVDIAPSTIEFGEEATFLPSSEPTTGFEIPVFPTSEGFAEGTSDSPSEVPTISITASQTSLPSDSPSDVPTVSVSTSYSSDAPSNAPTISVSTGPTSFSDAPSNAPTISVTASPTSSPSESPSDIPTISISASPSSLPSDSPSDVPTLPPSEIDVTTTSMPPISLDSDSPSEAPSLAPSEIPSEVPSLIPSDSPSDAQTNDYSLKKCEADCDSDKDCGFGLVCYKRTGDSNVPGCVVNADLAGAGDGNFCIEAPNSNRLVIMGDGNTPQSAFPLGECQGDCDEDDDCAAGLKCFIRSNDARIPNCSGRGAWGNDYCYRPPPILEYLGAYKKNYYELNNCQGDCNNDSDCGLGLICMRRGINSDGVVSGCIGNAKKVGTGADDFCILRPTSQTLVIVYDADDNIGKYPVGRCEGDCQTDADCEGNLSCFDRSHSVLDQRCNGLGDDDYSYCA